MGGCLHIIGGQNFLRVRFLTGNIKSKVYSTRILSVFGG